MSNVPAKTSKKKSFQHETTAYNPIVISNFTQQLNSLIVICKELQENQYKIIVNQQIIQTKLEILQEDKSSPQTLNESLKSEFKKYHETITAKFDQCQHSTEKVHRYQTEHINNSLEPQVKVVQEIKEEINTLKNSFENQLLSLENKVCTEIGSNRKNVDKSIKSYSEAVSAKLVESTETKQAITSINCNVQNLQTNITTKLEQETEAFYRKKKELNVCVFNVPESTAETLELQRMDDIKALKKVLNGKLVIQPEDLKNIYRIGKKSEEPKARPIIMMFTNKEKRYEILQQRELKYINEDSAETVNIYINPDRTKKQREELKELRSRLKERREKGELNIKISNGKIIENALPFRGQPQLCWGDSNHF